MKKDVKALLLAITIVLVDLVFFIVPLGSVFLAYVLIWKPKWVREYVEELYKEEK